jgi:hypothetical protein
MWNYEERRGSFVWLKKVVELPIRLVTDESDKSTGRICNGIRVAT